MALEITAQKDSGIPDWATLVWQALGTIVGDDRGRSGKQVGAVLALERQAKAALLLLTLSGDGAATAVGGAARAL